jgi:hypothetical protein
MIDRKEAAFSYQITPWISPASPYGAIRRFRALFARSGKKGRTFNFLVVANQLIDFSLVGSLVSNSVCHNPSNPRASSSIWCTMECRPSSAPIARRADFGPGPFSALAPSDTLFLSNV